MKQDDPVEASKFELPVARLRWLCPEDILAFSTTAEVEPVSGVVGQDDAVESLRFGLEFAGPGQNVYVRGLTGTGRATLVEQMLCDIRPNLALAEDRCYVHNFAAPDSPRLLVLPRGQGPAFAHAMEGLIEFVRQDLAPALSARHSTTRSRRPFASAGSLSKTNSARTG